MKTVRTQADLQKKKYNFTVTGVPCAVQILYTQIRLADRQEAYVKPVWGGSKSCENCQKSSTYTKKYNSTAIYDLSQQLQIMLVEQRGAV